MRQEFATVDKAVLDDALKVSIKEYGHPLMFGCSITENEDIINMFIPNVMDALTLCSIKDANGNMFDIKDFFKLISPDSDDK